MGLDGLRPEWHERAACRSMGTAMFFPGQGEPAGPAKQICATCPTRVECLADALDNGDHHGIWGGTSERERRRIRYDARRSSIAVAAEQVATWDRQRGLA